MMRMFFLIWMTPAEIFKLAMLCKSLKDVVDPNTKLITTDSNTDVTSYKPGYDEDKV